MPSLGRRGPYGQRVGLGVEDVFVQTEKLRVVGKEQVEVLQCLSQEETLHLVSGLQVRGVTDVVDRCVAALRDLPKKMFYYSEDINMTTRNPGVA